MRVKIGYTVELEDIENEVKDIMQRALLNIEDANGAALDGTSALDTDQKDIPSIVQAFELARTKLTKADMILSDCQEILIGYTQILQKSSEEEHNEEL